MIEAKIHTRLYLHIYIIALILCCANVHCIAQSSNDTSSYNIIEVLDEVIVTPVYKDSVSRDDSLRLRGRVLRTWEYATLAADRLQEIDSYRKDASRRQFRHAVNDTQKELFSQYEDALKKMSRNDGRVLIKLIHRLTGLSTYDIARNLKSGWKAWWWNSAASMFSLSLKKEYAPFYVAEDRVIENIIKDFFRKGYIMYYPAHWENLSYFYTPNGNTSSQMQDATSRATQKKERKYKKRHK